jgi:hypothetical protein
MDTIKDLLSSISKLYEEERQVKLKKREAGEFFNVFNTIGLWSEEVRLHSAFIAELLNPKGSHGLGGLFLQAFLEELDLPDDYINVQRCSQNIVERVIGPVTETKGGRIDIIIEDGNHAIIIENKIYAGDQYHQLLRYHNYGKKKFPNGYKLIYLSLDGHEAESCSVGKGDYNYETISYENNIVEWLEKCYVMAEGKPLVQSVIKQYYDLIKQITNTDMDTKYKEKLMAVMLAPENVNAVGEIIKLQSEWMEAVYEKYIWIPLEQYAKSKGMKFGKDCEWGNKDGRGAWIYEEEWKYYGLFIWTDRKYDWYDMFIGVSSYEKPNKKNKLFQKDYCQLNCLDSDKQTEGCPYGWISLPDNIRNWDYDITDEIVQGEVVNYITRKFDEMIAEIDERKLLMP